MSQSLKLSEQLLSLGLDHLRIGRHQEALRILGKVARLGELPADISEQTQVHLAEIYSRWGKHKLARRHLRAALALDQDSARYHHLMAEAIEEDDEGDTKKALWHLRRSVELDPNQPDAQCDYGLTLLELGKVREGLKRLNTTLELAPDEPKFVRIVAFAQLDAGKPELARRTVLFALFRNPDDGRLKKLWYDLRFREVREEQHAGCQDTPVANEKPTILPFPRLRTDKQRRKTRTGTGAIIRLDSAAPVQQPHKAKQSG